MSKGQSKYSGKKDTGKTCTTTVNIYSAVVTMVQTKLEELYTCLIQPHIVHGHRNSHWEILILSPHFYFFWGGQLYRRIDELMGCNFTSYFKLN